MTKPVAGKGFTYTMLSASVATALRDPALRQLCRAKVLCKTLGGLRCDLLEISNWSVSRREKRTVVISSRVHPGETNASWMAHGLIGFLLSPTAEAEVLRDNFVFQIVPMLNPDGVICGNYRCGLCGVDLNRQWQHPSKALHGTVYAMKKMIRKAKKSGRLCLYVDLHGHSRKQGIFSYACGSFPPDDFRRFTVRMYPKLLGMLIPEFAASSCRWSTGKGKRGTGRVVVAKGGAAHAAAALPGSWQYRERAARPALRLAAAGARVPGSARRRTNAAWHAAVAPAAGFARVCDAAISVAASGTPTPSTPPALPRQVEATTPTKLRKVAPLWPEGWLAREVEGKGQGDDDDDDGSEAFAQPAVEPLMGAFLGHGPVQEATEESLATDMAIDDEHGMPIEEGFEDQAPDDEEEKTDGEASVTGVLRAPSEVQMVDFLSEGMQPLDAEARESQGSDVQAVAGTLATGNGSKQVQAEITFEVDFSGCLVIGAQVSAEVPCEHVFDLLEGGCVVVPSRRLRDRALPAAWITAAAAKELRPPRYSQPFARRLARLA
ncbi:unnamed protein product [Prorocentrum cordatum]|uniref:Peptidase M14 domain-containing protein n=1 Tax=Prorocentrum cordatum TaxID=2364126 RepID=A0ABN9US84_9DINO|nr:unnamed protein product [Polarella glacialis]